MSYLLRSFLFRLDPEKAHSTALGMVRLAWILPPVRKLVKSLYSAPDRPVEAFGLRFRNPVGLAAGYDKDGLGWRALTLLGFGHIEVGTVTLEPQQGNPRPRVFRLIEHRALINRMGFPSRGAFFVSRRLQGRRLEECVIGVNIGKNRQTPLETAESDYCSLFQVFAPLADYIAVNVSSPNTEGLRQLQARQALNGLLKALAGERRLMEETDHLRVPILVKLAPDLNDSELDDALDAMMVNGIDGVIATNTTTRREGLVKPRYAQETGGLSGEPLAQLALEMVRKIQLRTEGRLPVVGAGGITDETGAQSMLDAGAVLIQLYTGLVYEGPGLVRRITTNRI
jgi:dihydroorotate dehydrogenase